MFVGKLLVVAKKTDPEYSQIAGHIPKGLALEFRVALTQREMKISEGLEAAIRLWLTTEASDNSGFAEPIKKAIAIMSIRSLISERDLEVLSAETKLPQQRLAQLIDGDYPTDIELTLLEKGLGVPLEQLVELRRQAFSSKRKEANGV